MALVRVKIENDYSDGHHSEEIIRLDAAGYDLSDLWDWFENVVYPCTGDGHGADADLGACYTATIVGTDEGAEELLGETYEWVD